MEKQRQKILVVDDSEMNRSILADMLGEEYDILEAEDGEDAVSLLEREARSISLVLLDIMMPKLDGFGVLGYMNIEHLIEDIPVIIISAESGSNQVERAYEMGVTDFIMRPFDALIVRRRVVNTLLLYAKQKRLIAMVNDQIKEKEQHSALMIDILSHIVEFRNGESGQHILHVRKLTQLLLKHLASHTGQYHLSEPEIALISTASALHDIGKIAIDEHILNKPGRLTKEEFEVMKTHSAIGAGMLEHLPVHQDDPLVRTAYEICRWHHERYDGRGYPDGLKGDEIPIAAQVVALADVYDALTSDRVYKKALPHERAVEMILNGECGAFNPLLLDCLREIADTLQQEMANAAEPAAPAAEARNMAKEMLNTETAATAASDRTLRLLDHERMKFNFFAALTEEIQFEYTLDADRLTVSPWGAKRLGVAEIIQDPAHDAALQAVLGPNIWPALSKKLRATTPEQPNFEDVCHLHVGGEPRWFRIILRSTWSSENPPVYLGALGKAIDVHEAHTQLEELERKASRDGLTGLLNRASAKERIEARLAEYPEGRYALAIFDLDHLKEINDTHGHATGDSVLHFLAKRLEHSVRGRDISARAGGDEFMLFLEYKEHDDISAIITRIFRNLSGICEGCSVTVSMGVARSDTVAAEYETLFRAADRALYAVKRAGRAQFMFYDDSMKDMFSVISEIDDDKGGATQ